MVRILLLISGGYDSPVAGHLIQKSDPEAEIIALHFSQEPFVDQSHELKAKEISQKLGFSKFISVNIGNELLEISQKAKHSYYFILMKRLMYKVATKIAKLHKCDFLATGESVAQVSSQTLSNLLVLEDSLVDIPILRPLVCYSKNEIISISKEIGTYEISTQPESCDRLGPKHPVVNAPLEHTLHEEQKLDIDKLIWSIASRNQINILI